MHTPQRRVALSTGLVIILFALLPQTSGAAAADPRSGSADGLEFTPVRRLDLGHAQSAGGARRLPTEAQHTSQTSRVGGQPRRSLVSQAAHGEVVAAPLPELILETPQPIAADPHHGGAAFELAGEIACGFESCGVEGCTSCAGVVTHAGHARLGNHGRAEGICKPSGLCGESIPLSLPILRINWCRFEFFGGVQGFAGPPNYAGVGTDAADRDGSSSFGIHEGFNEARPLGLFAHALSAQLGMRAVQSNFAGAEFTDNERRQIFVTGGFFRRVDYGLQGGLVLDYLHDDWYYDLDLLQLRGEISWMTGRCHEFGYGYMASVSDDTSNTTIETAAGTAAAVSVAMEAVDQHRFFYRRHFREGGHGEAFAGVSGEDDGLLGASLELPLRSSVSLRTGVTYVIPESGARDHQEESWNLGVSMVWYPCGRCGWSRHHRPLIKVADNGTFLVGRQ